MLDISSLRLLPLPSHPNNIKIITHTKTKIHAFSISDPQTFNIFQSQLNNTRSLSWRLELSTKYRLLGSLVFLHGDLLLPVPEVNPHEAPVLPLVHVQQVRTVLISPENIPQVGLEIQFRSVGLSDDLEQHVLLHLQPLVSGLHEGTIGVLALHELTLELLQGGGGPPVLRVLSLQGAMQHGPRSAGLHLPLLLFLEGLALLMREKTASRFITYLKGNMHNSGRGLRVEILPDATVSVLPSAAGSGRSGPACNL